MQILHPTTANTILYCREWEATVAFYRDRLGLPVTYAGEWFVEFALTATARLSVADERRASVKSAGGAGITLTFQVADAAAVRTAFESAGLTPGPLKRHAWGATVFYLHDPEGHRLEVWSPLPAD
jgi:catechol 2,3-dioxygenase-like lactoylglutathione lyase family enzyme